MCHNQRHIFVVFNKSSSDTYFDLIVNKHHVAYECLWVTRELRLIFYTDVIVNYFSFSVSGKITKTTQWSHGHISVFRLLCTRPRTPGRMASMFTLAHDRQRRAH